MSGKDDFEVGLRRVGHGKKPQGPKPPLGDDGGQGRPSVAAGKKPTGPRPETQTLTVGGGERPKGGRPTFGRGKV